MKVELLGALDYERVKQMLQEKLNETDNPCIIEEIVKELKQLEVEQATGIVATAGRLSRFTGNVFDVLGVSSHKTIEENTNYIKKVTGMGHTSIEDHDYMVFAIQDVSPVVEQILIEERFASFTIKSRREVDFSNVGFYVPTFRDKNGNVLSNNEMIQEEYKRHMNKLFSSYSELLEYGLKKEDARFVLPYSYHSNILMGMDAHTLQDLIIRLTKTKYADIQEVREFGEKLYDIAKKRCPYIIDKIDGIEKSNSNIPGLEKLDSIIPHDARNQITNTPVLLSTQENIDDTILLSEIMVKYQIDKELAKALLDSESNKNPDYKLNLMRDIANDFDDRALAQASFVFQIPLSLAVLTHLTRHRTHHLMTPDFTTLDPSKYVTPDSMKVKKCESIYHNVYKENYEMYLKFKNEYGVCDEDLVYFLLSGTITNSVTNIDGQTLRHISGLRECNKAQWEIRHIFDEIHKIISKLQGAECFSELLGPKCTRNGVCTEGRECCGFVYSLTNCNMP